MGLKISGGLSFRHCRRIFSALVPIQTWFSPRFRSPSIVSAASRGSSRIGKDFLILSISSDETEDQGDAENEEGIVCPFSFRRPDGGIAVLCFSDVFDDLMFAINSRFKLFLIPAIGECIAKCCLNGLLSAVSSSSENPYEAVTDICDGRCRTKKGRKFPADMVGFT